MGSHYLEPYSCNITRVEKLIKGFIYSILKYAFKSLGWNLFNFNYLSVITMSKN